MLLKGSEVRHAGQPVNPLFLDRWSPRLMTGEAVPGATFEILLEAARWAPSSYNAQPWRILYAHRDDAMWPQFLDLLVDANRRWAQDAGVLLVMLSRTIFEHNGKPARTHSFDSGAAWENLALQGALLGLVVHGMQGFDYDGARAVLHVPDHYQVEMMAAVGIPRDRDELDAEQREKEQPNDRKPVAEIAFAGRFPEGRS